MAPVGLSLPAVLSSGLVLLVRTWMACICVLVYVPDGVDLALAVWMRMCVVCVGFWAYGFSWWLVFADCGICVLNSFRDEADDDVDRLVVFVLAPLVAFADGGVRVPYSFREEVDGDALKALDMLLDSLDGAYVLNTLDELLDSLAGASARNLR
jgi:hypothetical protein